MNDFNKSFEDIARPNKSEESLKQFSNWILGISFAVCSFLILESKDLLVQNCNIIRISLKVLLGLSMLSALISGITKYMILNRDVKLSVKQDILKRIMIDLQLNKVSLESAITDWDNHMKDWSAAFVTIGLIGKVFNISLGLTSITIILTGIFILVTI
jgi:hypothetical protein